MHLAGGDWPRIVPSLPPPTTPRRFKTRDIMAREREGERPLMVPCDCQLAPSNPEKGKLVGLVQPFSVKSARNCVCKELLGGMGNSHPHTSPCFVHLFFSRVGSSKFFLLAKQTILVAVVEPVCRSRNTKAYHIKKLISLPGIAPCIRDCNESGGIDRANTYATI